MCDLNLAHSFTYDFQIPFDCTFDDGLTAVTKKIVAGQFHKGFNFKDKRLNIENVL